MPLNYLLSESFRETIKGDEENLVFTEMSERE